jgi:hypothetical protein
MTPTRMRAVAASVAVAAGFAALTGCDGSSRQPAAEAKAVADKAVADADRPRLPANPTAKLPKPDVALIGYDADTRTLVLYTLPDPADKWVLHVPDQPKGLPVNTVHQFMEEVDPDRVAVSYTTAAGHPSPRVTLREVLAARDARAHR